MIRARDRQRFRRAPWFLVAWITMMGAPVRARADSSGSAGAQSNDPWWGRDKALHLSVSAALSSAGYAASSLVLDQPWQRASAGAAFALSLGIGKEIRDSMGYGQASYKDLMYDVAGTALGLTLAYLVDWATAEPKQPATSSKSATLVHSPLVVSF